MTYEVSREIGIDMSHRITNHHDRCSNVHGHRYKIIASVTAKETQNKSGTSSEGMLIDFSFIKDVMINNIHEYCDHVTCFWIDDIQMCSAFGQFKLPQTIKEEADKVGLTPEHPSVKSALGDSRLYWDQVKNILNAEGSFAGRGPLGKFYIISQVPTAENLAKHWFNALENDIVEISDGLATLTGVTVYETPNCVATYCPDKLFEGTL